MNASFSNSHLCQTVSDAALPIQKPRVSYIKVSPPRAVSQRNKLMTPDEFGGKVPEVFSNKTYKNCSSVLEMCKSRCYLLLPIATSFSVAGFPSTVAWQQPRLGQNAYDIRRRADSGVLRGAFLDLTYHNGRCHCAVSSCKPCHRRMRCCDLGIRKNTVLPNLFVN